MVDPRTGNEISIQEAVAAGAALLCGGEKISASCYQPTVLLNPPADAKVHKLLDGTLAKQQIAYRASLRE